MVSITVKVLLPESKFVSKGWLNEIARVQRRTSVPRLRKLFQKTVFGWSKKTDFGWVQKRSAGEMSITMYPQGIHADIWELVNAGSPRHRIPKHGTTYMKFRPGYRSATTPGRLQSRRAYRSGKPRVAYVVNHPGFEARKFDELIAQEYENPFINDMQDAINTIAKENV